MPAVFASPEQRAAAEERDLALRYLPRLYFDRHEPFLPLVVGYTLFRRDAPSPSFPRQIVLPPGAALAVEYAIWWDWDIQHLYELEHVWVYADPAGRIVEVEASRHGQYEAMRTASGDLPLRHGRPALVAEPGKHAFAAEPEAFRERAGMIRRHCSSLSGVMGLHVTPLFEPVLRERRNPLINNLVRRYLRRRAFQPSFDFSLGCDLGNLPLVPWPILAAWIPARVAWWSRRLYWLALAGQTGDVFPTPRPDGRVWERSGLVREIAWRLVVLGISLYMDGLRTCWLGGQALLGVLGRLGLREESLFAAFRQVVLEENLFGAGILEAARLDSPGWTMSSPVDSPI